MPDAHDSSVLLRRRFEAVKENVPPIRHAARHVLRECVTVTPEAAHMIEVLISETITNAIRHSLSDQVALLIERCDLDTIRVTVTDQGRADGMPHLASSGPEVAEGGRGVRLLDGWSHRWGVTREPSRAVSVWFEVKVSNTRGDGVLTAFLSPEALADAATLAGVATGSGEGR